MPADNQNMGFKKKALVTAIASALALGGTHAMAQSQEETQNENKMEEFVVIGIRGSLKSSVDQKQDSLNVVDMITAEDIGKFPDQNVAESLQRITGVSIDRSGGEGQLISVRGMGPEFNSVLLNGRTMATISGGRAFSFDILAAELINGAKVYKTQSSSIQEGSIGATVDITTFKPMNFSGFRAAISAKALQDDMTGETSPQFSGLISNTFNDKFGILGSISFYERESRYDTANTARYFKTTADLDGQNYGEVYFPRNYDQIAKTETRERTSGTLVLQYKPSDTLSLTADALFSKYDVKYREDVFPMWFTPDTVRNPVLDEHNTLVRGDFVDSFIETLVRQSDASNDLSMLGLNADWQAGDNWNMIVDVSTSEAESDPGKGWSDVVAGRPGEFSYDRTSGDLIPVMTFDPFQSGDVLTAGWTSLQGTRIKDEVLEAKINNIVTVDAGPLVEIGFGAYYSDRTLGSTFAETEYPLPWAYGDTSPRIVLPASLFSIYNADGFLSGGSGNAINSWPTFNSDDVMAYLITEEAVSQLDPAFQDDVRDIIARNGGYTMVPSPEAYEVNEELTSLYVDFNFESSLADMPLAVVAGVRYVETQSTSSGRQITLLDLTPSMADPDEVFPVYSDDYLPVNVSNSYSDVLPSINAKLNITGELVARLAYSKSITRPELDELSPVTRYDGGMIDALTGFGSNPKLGPFESTNLDYSLEWYYDEGSYAAIAGFRKDVDGYLSTAIAQESVTLPSGTYNYEVFRPVNLENTKIDGVELAVQHMFENGFGVIANMTFVDSSSSSDEPGQKLPLIGLGDTQNLILLYEKNKLQFRMAYNVRDRFLQDKPTATRDGHYVADYKQFDISASYSFTEDFTAFFEGINITNELYIKNAEFPNQTLEVIETGPRYIIGIRAKF